MSNFISTIVGGALVVIAIRDIGRELLHPQDTGSVSRFIMHGLWRTLRWFAIHGRRSALFRAGPLILVAVAAAWTALLAVGFAFIYWPRLPASFHIASGLAPSAGRGFMTALYFSGATLSSVGATDFGAQSTAVRLISVIEGLLGLVMITAWITWTLSIYPVIADRRAFARLVQLLRRAAPPADSVHEPLGEATAEMLRTLTEHVLRIGSQLRQSRITYYFQSESREDALSTQLPWVLEYARTAEAEAPESVVRRHGMLLRIAVEQVVADLGEQFVNMRDAPTEDIIACLAEDHLRSVDRAGRHTSRDRTPAGSY